jgi:hypothetical protein
MVRLTMSLPQGFAHAVNRLSDYAGMDSNDMAADLILCGLDHYETRLRNEAPPAVSAAFAECLRAHVAEGMIAYPVVLPAATAGQLASLAQACQQPESELAARAMAYAYRDWMRPE